MGSVGVDRKRLPLTTLDRPFIGLSSNAPTGFADDLPSDGCERTKALPSWHAV